MIKTNGVPGIAPRSIGKPTASFPGAVTTDQHLAIGVDRQQTTLATILSDTATSMTVANASIIVVNSLLSIDDEIVQVSGTPTGNSVPITRAFEGTTAAIHLSGATVMGLVDAYHHNTLVAEIEAIENALGPNLTRIPGSAPYLNAGHYIFNPQQPGGTITGGVTNIITLSRVPAGVNGTDTNHYLWVSGGTGTAEAVLITGGTAVAGAASGTLFFTAANTHTGAWTIQTATSGIKEAMVALGANGGTILVAGGVQTIHAPIIIDINNSVQIKGSGRDSTQLTADLNVSPVVQFGDVARNKISYSSGITDLTVNRVSGTIPAAVIGVYYVLFARCYASNSFIYRHAFGMKTDGIGVGLALDNVCFGWSISSHIWLKDMAELFMNDVEFGFNGEGGSIVPTFLIQITGMTNSIQATNCRFIGPSGGLPYAIGFTNSTVSQNEYFSFTNCNMESVNGFLYSDNTVTGIGGFSWVNCRITGNAGTPAAMFNLNPATLIGGLTFGYCSIGAFSGMGLTNPRNLNISNSSLGGVISITGGANASCVFTNNIVSGTVTFTGAFNSQLFIGYNSFVTGSLSYSGATGLVTVLPNYGDSSKTLVPGLVIAGTGPNFIGKASETGANNALVASLPGLLVQVGVVITLEIAHSLQAGTNSLNLNGEGPVSIINHRSMSNLATGYVVGAVIQLVRVTGYWLDMSS